MTRLKKKKMSKHIIIRCDIEFLNKVKKTSKKKGMRKSIFIRKAILKAIEEE